MEEIKFNTGDIVRLRTDEGPKMVVEGKSNHDARSVMCWFFDFRGQLQGYNVSPAIIYRVG